MSTKTIKQRIAVVAVSALTAGLFSVVSAPVANSATGVLVGKVYENITSAGAAVVSGTTANNGSYGILDISAADANGNQTVIAQPNAIVTVATSAVVNKPISVTVSATGLMSTQADGGAAPCFLVRTGTTAALTTAANLLSCSATAAGGTDTGRIFAATRAIGTSYTITIDEDTGTAGVTNVITVVIVNSHSNAANGGAAATSASAPVSNGVIATNSLLNPGALLQKATMFATGAITVATSESAISDGTSSTGAQRISVSGGTISSAAKAGVTGGTMTIAADKSRVDLAASTTNTHTAELQAVITPNSGVTSFVITGWNAYTSTASADWVITVTVASASLAGVASVADSTVAFTAADGNDATSDVAGANAATSRTPLYLNVQLNDTYGNDVTTSGLVVEVSSGAIVGLSANTGAVGGLTSANSTIAITSAVSPADINIRVQEATVGKGWAGTVKVTWNGILIATKSGTILGDIAKITLTPKKIGKNDGNATTDAFEYQATDANGTIVPLAHASLTLNDSSASGILSGAVGTATNSSSAAGKGSITCVSGATGKSSVTMQFILPSGTVIKSTPVEFSCAGDAVAYTASLDKASYSQGEIATLTVKFFDAKGNAANSMASVTANPNDAVISANQMTLVSAYTAAQKTDVAGTATFTLTVGTASGVVAGSYNAIVSFPTINAIAGKNQSVAYAVTAPNAVSNAEVLKSIVALIASINKQIQALQKLILARR